MRHLPEWVKRILPDDFEYSEVYFDNRMDLNFVEGMWPVQIRVAQGTGESLVAIAVLDEENQRCLGISLWRHHLTDQSHEELLMDLSRNGVNA